MLSVAPVFAFGWNYFSGNLNRKRGLGVPRVKFSSLFIRLRIEFRIMVPYIIT